VNEERASVDGAQCMGTATCASVAPEAFVIGPTGKASYVSGADVSLEELQEAADSCPLLAITVTEEAHR
jgi:ferredoxin